MKPDKTTFALFFGNRGFFPASLQREARREMVAVLKGLGHGTLVLPQKATRHGAVETPEEGAVYADFLRQNRGKFGGVILCLPNFGDETGAVAALKDAGVPILVQAYPDDLDRMAPELRRDAFCGKFSIMDVFVQYGVPFTALPPHTVNPGGKRFAENVAYFDRLCRVVKGMRDAVIVAVGARTTPFKTVRIDEVALQGNGITMETLDLSDVFARMRELKAGSERLRRKGQALREVASWQGVPDEAFDHLVRLAVILDEIIKEYTPDALAIRCWLEMQKHLGISPCVLLSALNESGMPTACEVDVGNAAAMLALRLASGNPSVVLDWNNNYAEADDKCILFHCGNAPRSMMRAKGHITEHAILANAVGPNCSYGCNTGRLAAGPFTYGSMLTRDGDLCWYLGEGRFTDDPIPEDFFGCAGVAEISGLQEKLQVVGYEGHRHHVSVTPGHVAAPVRDAFTNYLGYQVTAL
jgi:L-fucose isomerase-like protein